MNEFIGDLIERFPELDFLSENIEGAYRIIVKAFESGKRLYVCGNGGSAADSEHIVGELMKGFVLKREVPSGFRERLKELYGEEGNCMADRLQQGLPAISLTGHPALSTAFSNDVASEMVFAQQVFVMGQPGDVLLAISTSGNSLNVVNAAKIAKAKGMEVIAFTGSGGGKCGGLADCLLNVPANQTFLVQEYHLPLYHALCLMVEDHFYGSKS